MGGAVPRQQPLVSLSCHATPFIPPMHGLKPIFLALSLVLVALGLAYLGLGGRALMHHESRAGVLVGLGATATVVGAVLWALVRRMRDEEG
jgi:hypothetical protein